MTYVVAEPCVNCRYTDCAIPCPVEAFHLDDDMLVINPETCIDCDACVPECPVEAVFAEDKVPAEWSHFTAMNAEKALSGLPTITARLDPLFEETRGFVIFGLLKNPAFLPRNRTEIVLPKKTY